MFIRPRSQSDPLLQTSTRRGQLVAPIAPVTAALGLAFNSTLVALIISMGLMYFMHVVQSRQEAFVLETQTYCRDKLIDVMKVPAREENTSSFV